MNIKHSFLLISSTFILFSACNSQREQEIVGKTKRETISFAPKLTGRISEIYVKEGETVHKGDTLALLDIPEVDAKRSQVEGVLQAAQAQSDMANRGATANQLKQLKAKKDAIEEQYNFANKSFDRAKAMFEDSMMSPQAFDEAFAKFKGAEAQWYAVQAEYEEAINGVRMEQRTAAAGQRNQAAGALKEVQIAENERYIIATNDMLLETIALSVGELATAGYPLFNGYLPESLYFRVTIPESQMKDYVRGSVWTIRVPYLDQTYEAEIVQIKQLTRYATITTAYPDAGLDDALYEIKLLPKNQLSEEVLTNATIILER